MDWRDLIGGGVLAGGLGVLVRIGGPALLKLIQSARHGGNGNGSRGYQTGHDLGELKGSLEAVARGQESIASAMREATQEHQESRIVLTKLTVTLEQLQKSTAQYQETGREAMRRIDAIHEAVVVRGGGGRRARR